MKIYYLHGMGGSPKDWDRVNQIIPGECLPIPSGCSFDQAAEQLAQIVAQKEKPFTICGYSMGARLAVRMCRYLNANLPQSLLLLSMGLGLEEEKERLLRQESDAKWAALARQNPPIFWQKWYEQDLFASFRDLPEALRTEWMQERLSLKIEHLCSQLELLGPGQHECLLPELLTLKNTISLLYMAGERDKKYAELARFLSQKDVPIKMVSAGHILPLEAPMVVAKGLELLVLNEN